MLDAGLPVAGRAPAAVVGRPGHPRGDRALHARRARRRAVVPVEHRVHPPHQRPRVGRRRPPHRVRRVVPRARPRRRLPRRAGGHAARSPPPPGHDEVQPGPHVDGRRTPSASAAPTCASTGWRAPAATSSSGGPCRCGTADRRGPHFARAVAAADLRPAALAPGRRPTSCSGCGRLRRWGELAIAIEETTFRLADIEAVLAAARRRDRRLPGPPAGGVRGRAGRVGRADEAVGGGAP